MNKRTGILSRILGIEKVEEYEFGEQPSIMKLGRLIRSIRDKKKISQAEMAGELGISQNGYSKIERGEAIVTVEKLEKICRVLKVDTAYVFLYHLFLLYTVTDEYKAKDDEVDRIFDMLLYGYSDDEDSFNHSVQEEIKNDKEREYLEQTVKAQEETIQLLKEKIAMLENKNKE